MKTRFLALLVAVLLCAASAFAADSPVAPNQRRGVEQTFLTYPEWFLVHSPAEYAAWVAAHPAHDFPFIGHARQIWSSYASVTGEQLRRHYPSNLGYHVMIMVIAGSTTVEYALRSAYENTIGRLSWSVSDGELTAEDRYGARAAQEYVDFIRKEPWYLFDFTARLKGLWATTPALGPNMIRKWERRYALTSEYAVKAVYGKLIELATRAAYDPALLTTQVVVDRAPSQLPRDVKLVRGVEDGRAVLDLPRYYGFRIAATELARAGATLQDIAGNTGDILVTVWLNADQPVPSGGARVLFEQPLLTMPGKRRVALVLPVSGLSSFLLRADESGVKVEHVYDY
ncbi:hypothetical protein NX773_21390 [Massilia solisilvae]|uniref:Uncharacterized protein n=1 Tax=Massilia solisilvae TaxID=1811225 RepID=A0ABT2BS88_9BURK|nr:hypothetical protein [Massilia solisilvae]MCS0610728.1 hypothetical protein [Massilia solisilvae]